MKPDTTHAAASRRRHRLRRFRSDQSGATAVEYGLLIGGIALFILTAVSAVGTNIGGIMNKVATALH